MAKKISVLLFSCLIAIGYHSFSQSDSSSTVDNDKLIREFSFLPLPALAASPATGFMFGVAPSASWLMGDQSTTSRSSMVSSFIYTTKKQLIITFKTNIFLKDNSWNLMGDWRYFITSQPTFGLGTGPQSAKLASTGFEYDDGSYSKGIGEAQMMEFDYIRFHETFLKRISDTRFFAGLGYHLDYHYNINDQLLDLESSEPTITSHYAYCLKYGFDPTGYTLSGISVNALLDSRDNPINPYKGRYAFISLRLNPEFLGSTQGSSLLWVEYRDYLTIDKDRPRHLIGFWVYGNFVAGGNVPYLDLPAVGWDQFGRSGRAYPQGRFRGEGLTYAEIEYRLPLQREKDTFGAVAFINTTTASNKEANISLFDYLDYGAGLGLRIMYNKASRGNLTLDYGWGKYGAQGFYLNVNEAF